MELRLSINGMKIMRLMLVLAITSFGAWAGWSTHKTLEFAAEFNDYWKAAVDASESSDPEIRRTAKDYACHAVHYLELNGMTKGKTGVFYDGPENDVTAWFTRVQELVNRLDKRDMAIRQSGFQRGEALVKVISGEVDACDKQMYESALAGSGLDKEAFKSPLRPLLDGEKVKTPPGISNYPNNRQMGLWMLGSIGAVLFSLVSIQVLRIQAKRNAAPVK